MVWPSFPSLLLAFLVLLPITCIAKNYTVTWSQPLKEGDTVSSEGQSFELGFFTLHRTTNNTYLGIKYIGVKDPVVVWVANRETPITDSTGTLNISADGNLNLFQGSRLVWSTSNTSISRNPVKAQLLPTGNLVLTDVTTKQTLWQSFDSPTHTMLPEMKISENLKTGQRRYLNSWTSEIDPSPGEFDYGLRLGSNGSAELYLTPKNGTILYRTGHWNGKRFSGNPKLSSAADSINFSFVYRPGDEVYYRFIVIDASISMSWNVIRPTGKTERDVVKVNGSQPSRENLWKRPTDTCDFYNKCGPNGLCENDDCGCFPGFNKVLKREAAVTVQVRCDRKVTLNCVDGGIFTTVENVKLPDTFNARVDRNMSLSDCNTACRQDCSCVAYAATDIVGSGCIRWFGDLLDTRKFSNTEQDQLFLKVPSELYPVSKGHRISTAIIATIVVMSIILVSVIILFSVLCFCKRTKPTRKIETGILRNGVEKWEEELSLFVYATIASATRNFTDKIGEGGFGHVYKGFMDDGQTVAVKRLSNRATNDKLDEFLTEALLIARLQHRNLVRLLGCCTENGERMLVYEYMCNKSLDTHIFDEQRRALLDWRARANIILGIARGLVYLHEDSRLKIIHRDLKAGNVLLDEELNAKISDFGTARIFLANQSEDKTMNVIGTIGYISPEYAMDGTFSVKSDVFSFGVLMLEIISGMRNMKITNNKSSSMEVQDKNLLAMAWRLWREGHTLKMVDEVMSVANLEEVERYIQIGLLCVQECADDRPIMSYVLSMLTNEEKKLAEPNKPGIYQGGVARRDQQYSFGSQGNHH